MYTFFIWTMKEENAMQSGIGLACCNQRSLPRQKYRKIDTQTDRQTDIYAYRPTYVQTDKT